MHSFFERMVTFWSKKIALIHHRNGDRLSSIQITSTSLWPQIAVRSFTLRLLLGAFSPRFGQKRLPSRHHHKQEKKGEGEAGGDGARLKCGKPAPKQQRYGDEALESGPEDAFAPRERQLPPAVMVSMTSEPESDDVTKNTITSTIPIREVSPGQRHWLQHPEQ